MIKSGQFRNNDTTSKKVSAGSKNLEISKNNIKQFQSSLLIPTNFVFTLFLKCQIFEPTTHFFGCCIVVPELPTLNHVWCISKYLVWPSRFFLGHTVHQSYSCMYIQHSVYDQLKDICTVQEQRYNIQKSEWWVKKFDI